MTEPLILPIVHLNGTSKAELMELRCHYLASLRDAIDALSQMAPNQRDYYPKPNLYESALAQHRRRYRTLKDCIDEISDEIEQLDKS